MMAIHTFGDNTLGSSILLKTTPEPLAIDLSRTVILVIDMQNDFGAKGGMFERAGIDTSMIQRAVAPTSRVLSVGRKAGIKVIYLKMAFLPDLSDAGVPDSPTWIKLLRSEIGKTVRTPDNTQSRIFIRDTWNANILDELAPEAGDTLIWKSRYSGFYQTELDDTLKSMDAKYLIVTGCTTSICVESTIRDAMFRDYSCVLLEDCTGEPIANDLSRSNHEASILAIQIAFGWVSNSAEFIRVLEAVPSAVTGK